MEQAGSSIFVLAGNQVGAGGQDQSENLNAGSGDDEDGLRGSRLEQRNRSQIDDPPGKEQQETSKPHSRESHGRIEGCRC